MLGDIAALMQPTAPQVFAQLHKLNIYGPGGMFKEHVDTPVGEAHFGSLVVALPAAFEGGQLVVRHDRRTAELALGGGAATTNTPKTTEPMPEATAAAEAGRGAPSIAADLASRGSGGSGGGGGSGVGLGPLVHYVAFFSDCAHEVLPVSSGYRVTLTYNLIATDVAATAKACVVARGARRLLPTVQPLAGGSDPLVAKLRELMARPTWQPGGATLGFLLEHKYACSFDELTRRSFPGILKGGDRLLYAALCDELGLQAKFVPIHLSDYVDEDMYRDLYEEEGDKDYHEDVTDIRRGMFMGRDFAHDEYWLRNAWLYDISMWRALKEGGFRLMMDNSDILWLGLMGEFAKAKFPVRTVVSAYGNEPSTATVYSGVAMLLRVPAWGSPQRNAAMAPGGRAQEQMPGAGPMPAQGEEQCDPQ
ncbi:hypothetical protein GPECTOR_57g500 [Gonium pectorale]|uniref:Uncharacterized protein n=1 Tax=Gonium pectorale TaxID=33097 RepID=A0A150G792_GONPE|nr:hypothetical protein GPECTOR_57g500 [Gonium pectorale]|eukprot:KXZ45210.1 hypothetical protein GPECTOR_57g500 [Gonium pectorale]